VRVRAQCVVPVCACVRAAHRAGGGAPAQQCACAGAFALQVVAPVVRR